MHTIIWQGPTWPYVIRPPTETEQTRFIRNGYQPPALVRESDETVYRYLRAEEPPNYPVPAIWITTEITDTHVVVVSHQEYGHDFTLFHKNGVHTQY